MPIYGYGRILDVDLSSGKMVKRDIDSKFAKDFVGGMGFSCKILYDEVGPDVDPLGPENIVIFANGPLTGTQVPSSGRTEVTNKSPLTGSIGTGNTGGMWGVFLKHAGIDLIIVRGMARKPVYLWIDDDVSQLRDASHLWGKDAAVTTHILTHELSPSQPSKVSVLAIGPAGENLVRFACTLNDYHHVPARGGVGAVLGSKKLKAIAVRGTKPVNIARPEEFKKAVREAMDRLKAGVAATSRHDVELMATPVDVREGYVALGALPGRNFQTGFLPQWLETRGQNASFKYVTRKEGTCHACPYSCFDLAEVNEGKYAGLKVSRGAAPGAVVDWGAKCAIDNLPAIYKCKQLCQILGLDYASTAGVIAFAQELFQREIITQKDTDGVELTWGNEDAIIAMIHKIVNREGLGNVLAEGSTKAAKIIGKGAEKYVMAVKGMELMSVDARSGKRGWAFGEITNPRGGDNVKSTHFRADMHFPDWLPDKFDMFDDVRKKIYTMPQQEVSSTWEGKPMMTKWFEDLYSVANSLGVCFIPAGMRLALGPTHYAKLYSACTGQDTTPQEMMKLGEKIFNLLKTYTVRRGLTRKDDCWPDRFYTEPQPEGPAKGAILSRGAMDKLLDEYYEVRDWNKGLGVPTAEKLRQLGLGDVADDLLKREKI